MSDSRKKRYADAAERIVWTFVQAFAGSIVALGLDDVVNSLKISAVAGALSAAKSLAGWKIGNDDTSSTLPKSLDPATPSN